MRQWRKRKGLTQAQLAALIGVSASSIAKYESGENRIPYENAEKIAAALYVSIDDLFDFSDDDYLDFFIEEARQVFRAAGYQLLFSWESGGGDPDVYTIIGEGARFYISHDNLVKIMETVNRYSRFVIDEYLSTPEALGDD